MELFGKDIVVTGGAGFIGSHLVEKLSTNNHVVVLDNLSSGRYNFVDKYLADGTFLKGDLLDYALVKRSLKGKDIIFHLAANPDVRIGEKDAGIHFEQNLVVTQNILKAMKECEVKLIVFSSTAAVYGEVSKVPVPEDYGPLMPVSLYGASKLGCEALISAYCHTFGFQSWIFRFANIIGARDTHGVVYDFVVKLGCNPTTLKVLGDGSQTRTFLLVNDCIDAMLLAVDKTREPVNIHNIGSDDCITIKEVAEIVAKEAGLCPQFIFSERKIGWKGDLHTIFLDTLRMKSLGWKPKHSSIEAVRLTVRSLLNDSQTKMQSITKITPSRR